MGVTAPMRGAVGETSIGENVGPEWERACEKEAGEEEGFHIHIKVRLSDQETVTVRGMPFKEKEKVIGRQALWMSGRFSAG